MGEMIDGVWHTTSGPVSEKFERESSKLRDVVDAPEPGRYRLYVHAGCPWAHRTRIARRLLELENVVEEVLVAFAPTPTDGWVFDADHPDPMGHRALHQLYSTGARGYTGRCTVPVLWDIVDRRILNNESEDILRIFSAVFGEGALRPEQHCSLIDEVNQRVYEGLNNGVYRAGFAQTQSAHDEAARDVLDTLNWLESLLSDGRRLICGDVVTEADVRLWPTLLRFRAYREVFYCDLADPAEHPRVWAYRDRALDLGAVASTTLAEEEYVRGYAMIPFAVRNNPAVQPSREEVRLA